MTATYGKTPQGQLLYDLAFTNLDAKYLARKHKMSVKDVRRLRTAKEIKSLRKQNGLRQVLP